MSTSNTVPGKVLAAIKSRKFAQIARLCAPKVDFQGWTPTGHWTAEDGNTVAKIVEAWFSPGSGANTVVWSNETANSKAATLEYEVSWLAQPDDQPRVLREAWFMTLKEGRITSARVYCAGLHTEFPEVDLDKQRRSKGLLGPAPATKSTAPTVRAVAAKAP